MGEAGGSLAGRCGAGAVRRAGLLSGALACGAGAALLALPVLARDAYLDENALLAGAAAPGAGPRHAALGAAAAGAAEGVFAAGGETGACTAAFGALGPHLNLRPRVLDLPGVGAEVVVAGVRAPRGDGSEALVLVTPARPGPGGADALAAGGTVLAALGEAPWLAKDVIWLCVRAPPGADVAAAEAAALRAWLLEYHRPGDAAAAATEGVGAGAGAEAGRASPAGGRTPVQGFLRGGALQLAVALEPPAGLHGEQDMGSGRRAKSELEMEVVGTSGHRPDRLPNQDLPNTVAALARAVGAPLRAIDAAPLPTDAQRASVCPPNSFEEYWECLAGLFSFARRQAAASATDVPPGLHAPFAAFAVDAVTLRGALAGPSWDTVAVQRVAVLLELTLRSGNNLLEKFHHSSWLYVLPATGSFVGPDGYLLAPILACLALVLQAFSLVGSRGFSVAARVESYARCRRGVSSSSATHPPPAGKGWGVLRQTAWRAPPWVHSKAFLLSALSLQISAALLHSWAAALALLPAVPACLLLRPAVALGPVRRTAFAGAALGAWVFWALLFAGVSGCRAALPRLGPVILGAVAVLASPVETAKKDEKMRMVKQKSS